MQLVEFLKVVECSAAKGEFDVDVPTNLSVVMSESAYNRVRLDGARVFFNETVSCGDLRRYDDLADTIPDCLKELHREVKENYVSDAIERATNIRLDDEQLGAVLADEKVMKVTARAGSGKTRVLGRVNNF
ncbi:MAG: hypothetical protein ACQKBV_04185 [Puniceicoccales bacterium]